MAVDGQRTADGEVGVRLHDPNRQITAVNHFLDLSPGRTGLRRNRPGRWRECEDFVEASHVEVQGAWGRDLATHAVTRAADGNWAGMIPDGGDDPVDRRGLDDPADANRIELADIVDGARQYDRR